MADVEDRFKAQDVRGDLVEVHMAPETQIAPNAEYLPPTTIAAGDTATIWTPAAGKKIVLKRFSISTDTATRVELLWASTAFESFFLPANGTVIANLVYCNERGGTDEALVIKNITASASITAKASGDEAT